jgi:DNA ligase (NAD+)
MDKISKIKELTKELLQYCHEYYDLDNPSISDAEYDHKYDTLKQMEDEANFWLANSPTRKVQGSVLEGFTKVTHSKPMLSAAKTKDVNEIKKFIGNNDYYCSYKLDGLTLVVVYEHGKFKQATTRGTGLVGEDVTEQAKMIKNLPMSIPYDGYLELRGECVVSWSDFHKINASLAEPYSHPRNLAAGSLRNLDTNITKHRNLSWIAFECVSDLYDDDKLFDSKWDELGYLDYLGFETVERRYGKVEDCVDEMQPDNYGHPVDGLIFEMCMKEYSKSLASTAHHEGCRMALKWADSTYETVLRDVVWDVGRSGVISPVAVFDEIDLDGALTTRATLHNLSIIEGLELGIGDTITVYRSNMVIPKIDDNLTRSNTLTIPDVCPCCGHKAEVKYTDSSKFLMCTNPNCSSKLLARLVHFVSRNCMNIEGLSEATLEVLIYKGWVKDFKDIYYLYEHGREWEQLDGFGEKSVAKILDAIDWSRKVKLENFISALSIDGIGTSASKTIANAFNGSFDAFFDALKTNYDWSQLTDFGAITARNIADYGAKNADEIYSLAQEMRFVERESKAVVDNPFMGKTICVTGKLFNFTRDGINTKITELGAKAAGSVSKNTDYLITNEQSGSSKYKKAIELNIPIITEEEFLRMINKGE